MFQFSPEINNIQLYIFDILLSYCSDESYLSHKILRSSRKYHLDKKTLKDIKLKKSMTQTTCTCNISV